MLKFQIFHLIFWSCYQARWFNYNQLPLQQPLSQGNRTQKSTNAEWLPIRIQFQMIDEYESSRLLQINNLIGIAKQFFGTTILVRRLNQSLKFQDYGQPDCQDDLISNNLAAKEFDADLVVFYKLEEIEQLAQAAPCILDPQSQRPLFAIMNFGKAVSNTTDPGQVQFQKNIETIIHEIIHGLGFVNELFELYFDSNNNLPYQQATYKTQDILYLSTPRILNYTRHYFNCQTANGLPMEDQGGNGTQYSHWERRIFFNELMTGSQMKGDFALSIFTLALLEDSGWYRIGNISPDPMSFGHLQGCAFLYQGCKAGVFSEFCDESALGDNSQCSFTQTGIGICKVDPLSNQCAIVQIYDNFDCRDPINLQTHTDQLPLYQDNLMDFEYNSKCFDGSLSISQDDILQFSCHKFRCSQQNSQRQVQLTVGNISFRCEQDNQILDSPSLFGQISCPSSLNQFCQDYSECTNQCNERGICINKICYCMTGYVGQGCETTCNSYNYMNTCVNTCPSLTFADQNTMTCLGCPFGCSKCATVGSCSQCSIGYYMLNNLCERDFSVTLPEDIRYYSSSNTTFTKMTHQQNNSDQSAANNQSSNISPNGSIIVNNQTLNHTSANQAFILGSILAVVVIM